MNAKHILFSMTILGFFGNFVANDEKDHTTFYYHAQFSYFPKKTHESQLSLESWKKSLQNVAKDLHHPPAANCTIIFNDNHPDDDRFSCSLIVCACSNNAEDLELAVKTELLKYRMNPVEKSE
jgi:hypothetical protein